MWFLAVKVSGDFSDKTAALRLVSCGSQFLWVSELMEEKKSLVTPTSSTVCLHADRTRSNLSEFEIERGTFDARFGIWVEGKEKGSEKERKGEKGRGEGKGVPGEGRTVRCNWTNRFEVLNFSGTLLGTIVSVMFEVEGRLIYVFPEGL